MEFDNLLKIVMEKNKVNGEKCLICHFPDSSNNLEKLSCGHFFHLSCLKVDNSKKNCKIICPYCDKKIVIKKKVCIPVTKSNEKLKEDNICKFILKTGKNKGMICNRINCRYHR
tara:strand:+ start:1119 stop:1460 length:342 start_codon:yes stop_codon:yes gene_type:complete